MMSATAVIDAGASGAGGLLLSCDGLRRTFGDLVAVDGVTFSIAEGEAYGLLGPNGAGKSTTISMLCGLLEPDEGRVTLAGQPIGVGRAAGKQALGLVPQQLSLYGDLSARENLELFGRVQGLRGQGLRQRVDEVLELVGLADRAGGRIETFSGGMQRRTSIAAGLLHGPRLLVLDEPTVGVDPQSRNAILDQVMALSREGTSVLYTSHYMEEVERVCDRVGIMDHGRLIAEGTRRQLIDRLGSAVRVVVDAVGDLETLAGRLRQVEGVEQVDRTDGSLTLVCSAGRRVLTDLIAIAAPLDVELVAFESAEPDLEAVFLNLTGRALRD